MDAINSSHILPRLAVLPSPADFALALKDQAAMIDSLTSKADGASIQASANAAGASKKRKLSHDAAEVLHVGARVETLSEEQPAEPLFTSTMGVGSKPVTKAKKRKASGSKKASAEGAPGSTKEVKDLASLKKSDLDLLKVAELKDLAKQVECRV